MSRKKIRKCPMCGAETPQPRGHWRKCHQDEYPDFDDFIAKFEGIERPKCKWCGGQTYWNGSHQQFECGSRECKAQKGKHAQQTKMDRGTCNFSRENRPKDEQERDVLARKCADSAKLNREDPSRKERLELEERKWYDRKARVREQVRAYKRQEWEERKLHAHILISKFGPDRPGTFYCYYMSNLVDHTLSCKPGCTVNESNRKSNYHELGYRIIKGFTCSGTLDQVCYLESFILRETESYASTSIEFKATKDLRTNGFTEHRNPWAYDFILELCKEYVSDTPGLELEFIEPETPAIEGVLQCSKLVSVNRRLERTKGRIHLSPEYAKEIEELKESMSRAHIPANFLGEDYLYEITLTFMSPRGFLKSDTDNKIKAVIDAISEYLGINDNRIVRIDASKVKLTDTSNTKDRVYFKLQRTPLTAEEYKLQYAELIEWAKMVKMIEEK